MNRTLVLVSALGAGLMTTAGLAQAAQLLQPRSARPAPLQRPL